MPISAARGQGKTCLKQPFEISPATGITLCSRARPRSSWKLRRPSVLLAPADSMNRTGSGQGQGQIQSTWGVAPTTNCPHGTHRAVPESSAPTASTLVCEILSESQRLFLCEVISVCIAGSPGFVFPKDFLCKCEIRSPSCPMLEEHLLLPPAQRPRAARAELRNCWLSELCFCHLLHSCFFQSKLLPALQNAHSVAVLSVH